MEAMKSLFTKALRVDKPWEITEIEFKEGEGRIDIHIDFPRGSIFRCPRCGKEVKAYDTKQKEWRHMNFFQYACYMVVRVPRVECKEDGIHQIEVEWARSGADFTYMFESFAMILCREMPVNKVSEIIKVDDNKLWRMLEYYTDEARSREDYGGVERIGIDETSKSKGHDYVTIFVDLEGKRSIYVEEGKGSDVVKKFKEDFIKHGGNVEGIKEVSIDMSVSYIKGVEENIPRAEITFDKFHIIKLINEAVDEVRREEVKEREILRGQKYLFLKNRERLTERQRERLREIESMAGINLKTIKAYHIRENFQSIYEEITREGFERALKRWYYWATHSRIDAIKKVAKTIKEHWRGILRWYDSRINNGILEGLNSLVQAAKARARGFKTFKNFKIMIYMLTGKLDYSKVGLPT